MPDTDHPHTALPDNLAPASLAAPDEDPDLSDISSDSFGSIPGSPTPREEDPTSKPILCRWESCDTLQPSLHALVHHLQNDHFGLRRAKYTCEWEDCSRKGIHQPSRFALVSHMRSHTGEKPFFCTVPECDRNFTRSDALAKHLRTVHETEVFKVSTREPFVKSLADPIRDERPALPKCLSQPGPDSHNGDTGSGTGRHLYLEIKQMKDGDRLSGLLSHPLLPELSRPSGGGSLAEFWTDHDIDQDIFGPTTLAVMDQDRADAAESSADTPNSTAPSLAQLKQVFESLKRRLIWSLEQEADLSAQHRRLQKQKHEAWLETEMLMDKLIDRDLASDDEEGADNAQDKEDRHMLLWPEKRKARVLTDAGDVEGSEAKVQKVDQ